MDKETPRSHKGLPSSRGSEADSTRVIPVERTSHPAPLNSLEQSTLAWDRNRPRLSPSEETDLRMVPRHVPCHGPFPRKFRLQLPGSDEERTLVNYTVVPRQYPRPSSDEEETQGSIVLFPRAAPPPGSSRSYQVVSARTGSTTFSLSAGLPSTAREFGQPPAGEDCDSHPSEVPFESTRSKAKDASGSTSTVILTSSSPSRAEELLLHGTVDTGARCDSKFPEGKAEAPQPGGHDDGSSFIPVSIQQASDCNEGEVPVKKDTVSQQVTQIDSPSESKLAGNTQNSLSIVLNNGKQAELYNSHTISHAKFPAALSGVETGVPAIRRSQSGLGSSQKPHPPQAGQTNMHHDSKPEICNVIASREPLVSVRTPTSIVTFLKQGHETPDLLDSTTCRAQGQQSASIGYPQPAPLAMCQTDTPQRLREGWISNEDNGRELPRPPTTYPGHSNPRSADCRIGPSHGDLKLFRDAALNLLPHELFRRSPGSLEPEIVQTDTLLDVLNPLDIGSSHEISDSSLSESPSSTPGLDNTGFHDRLRSASNSSTASTDASEYSDPEDLPFKNRPSLGSVTPDALTDERITCLLFAWLYGHVVLDLAGLTENFRKHPRESGSGQASSRAGQRSLIDRPRRLENNGSTRRERDGDGGDEDEDQSKWPEQKGQKLGDSPARPLRPLACPFYKHDPQRYSGFNEAEKEYRNCSSGYWPDISRLKCYVTFEEDGEFDSHCRQQEPCERQAERQFQEKMNDQQLNLIKKKKPRATPRNLWNAIFKILFHDADVPESPYFETPENELRRSLPDHFRREVGPILSSLLLENVHPPLNVHPDLLDRICDTATTIALQRVASGSETAPSYPQSSLVPILRFEEAYRANPLSLAHLGTNLVQPQSEMTGPMFHNQCRPPSQGYPISSHPGDSVAPNPYFNMGLMGQSVSGGSQFPLPTNYDAGLPGASFDMAFAQIYGGGVNPTICPQSNSPLTYHSALR